MRYIKLDSNNKVTGIRIGPSLCAGEIESELGELGQILQPDGTYVTPPPPPPGPDPDDELSKAIQAATTLTELKAALLGNNGGARVKAKIK